MIPVQLEYTAPTGCPTQTEFVAFVANRGGDFARPGPGTKARAMVVTLRREGGEHTGSLLLRLDDMASDARQLRAATCAEIAEALAVVAAIALRGAEEPSEPTESAAPSPTAPAEPAPARPLAPKPVPAAPEPPRDTRLHRLPVWGNQQLPVTAGRLGVNYSLAATFSGGVVLGAIPGVVLPRYDFTWVRTNFITTPEHTSYIIGNVFGARWSYLGNVTHQRDGFSTKIQGFKAGVTACSSLAYDTSGFVALLCSGFAVGMFHTETKDSASAYKKSKDYGLGAATLELDLRYNIGKTFHVGLAAGGDFWLTELSAERPDGSELFHARLFNGNVQLGLGVHF